MRWSTVWTHHRGWPTPGPTVLHMLTVHSCILNGISTSTTVAARAHWPRWKSRTLGVFTAVLHIPG